MITPEGRALRKRMWPIFGKVIKDKLEDQLSAAELEDLDRLLGQILRRE